MCKSQPAQALAGAKSVVGLNKDECIKIGTLFKTVHELDLATLSWGGSGSRSRSDTRQRPLRGELPIHSTRASQLWDVE